jgi:hypothetical protein
MRLALIAVVLLTIFALVTTAEETRLQRMTRLGREIEKQQPNPDANKVQELNMLAGEQAVEDVPIKTMNYLTKESKQDHHQKELDRHRFGVSKETSQMGQFKVQLNHSHGLSRASATRELPLAAARLERHKMGISFHKTSLVRASLLFAQRRSNHLAFQDELSRSQYQLPVPPPKLPDSFVL